MTEAKQPNSRWNRPFSIAFGLLLIGIFLGKVPNPLERYFEIAPGLYRTIHDVNAASKSIALQNVLKETLDRDGKLTQANMEPIWPVYTAAIPNGFALGGGAEASDRDTERQRLIAAVGAQPQHVVSTFLSDAVK